MKYGKCNNCINKKIVNNIYWCDKHNKEINIHDIVICSFYSKNNSTI